MQLTVKDLKQVTHVIENLQLTDSVETLCHKVEELYNFTEGVRLIYCGRIIEKTKTLGEYFKEDNNSFIVCMPEKAKTVINPPVQEPQTQSTNQPNQQTQSTNQPNQQTQSTNQPNQQAQSTNQQAHTTYTSEQIRALMLVFMQFVRSSPDVFYVFCTNQRAFQELLLSDMFSNMVITPLLEASTQIINAINTNGDITIPIPVITNNQRQQNIFGQLYQQTQSTNQQTQSTNQQNQSTNQQNQSTNQQTQPAQPTAIPPPSRHIQSVQSVQSVQSDNQQNISNNILNTINNLNMSDQAGINGLEMNQTNTINSQLNQIEERVRQAESQLTDADKENINELTALGFSAEIATQTYIMCGKNKEVTASILFELM